MLLYSPSSESITFLNVINVPFIALQEIKVIFEHNKWEVAVYTKIQVYNHLKSYFFFEKLFNVVHLMKWLVDFV